MDGTQSSAGLGESIDNEHGHRTIATIGADCSFVYLQMFGLVLAFCAFGNGVTEGLWAPLGARDFSSVLVALPGHRRVRGRASVRRMVRASPGPSRGSPGDWLFRCRRPKGVTKSIAVHPVCITARQRPQLRICPGTAGKAAKRGFAVAHGGGVSSGCRTPAASLRVAHPQAGLSASGVGREGPPYLTPPRIRSEGKQR